MVMTPFLEAIVHGPDTSASPETSLDPTADRSNQICILTGAMCANEIKEALE